MSENKRCQFCGGRRIGEGKWSGYAAMYPASSAWRSSPVLTEVCCDCGQVLSVRVQKPELFLPKENMVKKEHF